MNRRRNAWDVFWPVVLLWLLLTPLGIALDADWPEHRRHDFLIIASIASFSLMLAMLLLRRGRFDALSISLASFFATQMLIWLYALSVRLWPGSITHHHWQWVASGLRVLLVVSMAWAVVMLVITPPKQREDGF